MTMIHIFNRSEDARTFPAGHLFYREGEERDFMYFVLEGEVDITLRDKSLETVRPGGFFGEIALIEGGRRLATATARTSCRAVPINEKRFLFLVQQTPFFALDVMKVLVERIRRLDRELGLPIEN